MPDGPELVQPAPRVWRQQVSHEPALEVVADYSAGGIKPAMSVDQLRLVQDGSWAQLQLKLAEGRAFEVNVGIENETRSVIATILERHQQGVEHLETHSEVFSSFSAATSASVNELLDLQRVMDTVEALRAPGHDQRVDLLQAKLWDRVELLYTDGFQLLRDELLGQHDGDKILRMLLESQNETLIDIALRLVVGEPGLVDAVQEELADVYLDRSLSDGIRSRAQRRLHPAVRRAAAIQYRMSEPAEEEPG